MSTISDRLHARLAAAGERPGSHRHALVAIYTDPTHDDAPVPTRAGRSWALAPLLLARRC